LGSAYWRAAHLRDDPPPWILEDRIAATILSADDVTELEVPLVGWDPSVAAGFRLHHVIRARVAEDVAVVGLDTGRADYAILGAGADTFAWRHRQASQFTVWEYDLAATQVWKRQALIDVGLGVPSNVRFVTIDLATTRLDAVDVPARATWSWMGVTMYLTPQAMTDILDVLAHLGTGTTVVANFALPPEECDELGLAAARSAASLVASVGEPVVATYRRGDVRTSVSRRRFQPGRASRRRRTVPPLPSRPQGPNAPRLNGDRRRRRVAETTPLSSAPTRAEVARTRTPSHRMVACRYRAAPTGTSVMAASICPRVR
jgi:methyltransferase (TIGR00027 family)